jgi:hypothetical protein
LNAASSSRASRRRGQDEEIVRAGEGDVAGQRPAMRISAEDPLVAEQFFHISAITAFGATRSW